MQYISVVEYLMGRAKLDDLDKEIVANINTLIPKVNELLEKFGEYRRCNSGIRLVTDQIRIYKEKNEARKKQGLPPVTVPMGSCHLKGAAIDLEDANGKLYKWCKDNIKILEQLGLYCEERQGGWLHVQIFAPKSGRRFFNP